MQSVSCYLYLFTPPKWYLVNISLFASDLFPAGCKPGEISSDLKQIGSAGIDRNRSYWDLAMTIGMPFSRWGATPFVVSPVPFFNGELAAVLTSEPNPPAAARPHPFHLAVLWRDQLAGDPDLNLARIAARESLSRARVTQIMNLLQLPESIRTDLAMAGVAAVENLPSERQLRRILALKPEAAQVLKWRDLLGKTRN